MNIAITRLHKNGSGNVKAFLDFEIEGIGRFTEYKLVQISDEKGPFVSGPARSYTDKEGSSKYTPYVRLLDSVHKEITKAAISAYNDPSLIKQQREQVEVLRG